MLTPWVCRSIRSKKFSAGEMSGKFKTFCGNDVGSDRLLPLYSRLTLKVICATSDGFTCGFYWHSTPPSKG